MGLLNFQKPLRDFFTNIPIRNLRASIAVNPTTTTMSQNDTSAAWPQADQALSTEILDLVQQSTHARQLKKGALFRTQNI